MSAFWRFLAPKVPKSTQKALFGALRGRRPKLLKKHSVGHFQARAPEHSCKWRPGSQTKSPMFTNTPCRSTLALFRDLGPWGHFSRFSLTLQAGSSRKTFLIGRFGCGFFAYRWKLPAYSGAFLLTVDNFSFFAYSWSFLLTVLASLLTVGALLLTVGKRV